MLRPQVSSTVGVSRDREYSGVNEERRYYMINDKGPWVEEVMKRVERLFSESEFPAKIANRPFMTRISSVLL